MQLGIYQHYRGNLYHVIGLSRHSESLEEMVVYRGLHADFGLWVRPKVLFQSQLEVEGILLPRFKFIRELDTAVPALR